MTEPLKVAVVTPYYKEPAAILRRCMESVQAQNHPHVAHYMVADGVPQPETMAGWPQVRHITLPNGHANFGSTPRGIGALCALADGFDVVCFLDVDNLFLPDHAASLAQVYERARAAGEPLDAVFASRYLFLPGHEHLRLVPPGEGKGSAFVDTSCMSLSRSAGFLWGAWCQLPRSLTPICDRAMCKLMQDHKLQVAWTDKPTVLYEARWKRAYRLAGLAPPENGLHDETLDVVGEGLTEEETWALLRVKWTYVKNPGAPSPGQPRE